MGTDPTVLTFRAMRNKTPTLLLAAGCWRFPASISAAEQQRLATKINYAVVNEVLPAYPAFASFVATDYAPMPAPRSPSLRYPTANGDTLTISAAAQPSAMSRLIRSTRSACVRSTELRPRC
jgi:hypothetical protein